VFLLGWLWTTRQTEAKGRFLGRASLFKALLAALAVRPGNHAAILAKLDSDIVVLSCVVSAKRVSGHSYETLLAAFFLFLAGNLFGGF
jgi:hypothetical protein